MYRRRYGSESREQQSTIRNDGSHKRLRSGNNGNSQEWQIRENSPKRQRIETNNAIRSFSSSSSRQESGYSNRNDNRHSQKSFERQREFQSQPLLKTNNPAAASSSSSSRQENGYSNRNDNKHQQKSLSFSSRQEGGYLNRNDNRHQQKSLSFSFRRDRDEDSNFSVMSRIAQELEAVCANPSERTLAFIFNQLLPSKEMAISKRFQEDFYNWCLRAKNKSLAYILFNAGKIVKSRQERNGLRPLTIEFINLLLNELSRRRKLEAKSISIAFTGMKRLAGPGLLSEALRMELMQNFLVKLPDLSDCSPQKISSVLHGLAILAEKRLLKGKILHIGIIEKLLTKLLELPNCDSQAISNALYGIGNLAEKELLMSVALRIDIIQKLLYRLLELRGNPQAIGNTLYGLGKLAEKRLLSKALPTDLIQRLLGQLLLPRSDHKSQNISNALHGVGKLAEKGLLNGILDAEKIHNLSKLLGTLSDCKPQNIGNALHGIGKLAEQGLLKGTLSTEKTQDLLGKLLNPRCDCNSQNISNALHGVGKVSKGGLLRGEFNTKIIQALLDKLLGLGCNPRDIGSVLHGVGKVAESRLLSEALPIETIQSLLIKLSELHNCDSQAIANTLHGLGKLIEKNRLNKKDINLSSIDSLLTRLNKMRVDNRRLCSKQVLFCLRMLDYTKLGVCLLYEHVKAAVISPRLNPVEAIRAIKLLSIYPKEILQQQDTLNLFQWLIEPLQKLPRPENKQLYDRFSQELQTEILNIHRLLMEKNSQLGAKFKICFLACEPSPLSSSQRSTQVSALRSDTDNSVQLFQRESRFSLPNAEGHPNSVASVREFDQFLSTRETISNSEDVAQPMVSQSSTVRVRQSHLLTRDYIPFYSEVRAPQQNIFECIMRGDLQALIQLLGYDKNANRIAHVRRPGLNFWHVSQGSRERQLPLSPQQEMVETFLMDIPDRDLEHLFEQSNINDHLFVLFDFCRRHTFYQLAREISFRRFYHIPVDKLQKLVEKIKHPLMLHRDSKALLNAISAIGLHPNYYVNTALRELQINLLDAGITYHNLCNHHIVLQFLQTKKNELDKIVDNQDEETDLHVDDLEYLENEICQEDVVIETTDTEEREMSTSSISSSSGGYGMRFGRGSS